jgi:hypothetical protein
LADKRLRFSSGTAVEKWPLRGSSAASSTQRGWTTRCLRWSVCSCRIDGGVGQHSGVADHDRRTERALSRQPKPGVGRGRHSPLYWWLFTRADEVRAILEQGRPLWDDVAAHLPETALDGTGKRPTGDRARKAWVDVCKAKGWQSRGKDLPPSSGEPPPSLPLPTIPAEDPPLTDDDEIILTAADGTPRRVIIRK